MTALLFRNVLWALLLPGVIAGFIPWLVFGFDFNRIRSGVQIGGLVLFAAGVFVLLLCIIEFARRGRGTLSPLDPPRGLVVTGMYRLVRNPMYVGVLAILVGEALIARSLDLGLYTAAFFVGVNVFIIGYEEPFLQRTYGSSYMEYREHVRRWVPRVRPWLRDKP